MDQYGDYLKTYTFYDRNIKELTSLVEDVASIIEATGIKPKLEANYNFSGETIKIVTGMIGGSRFGNIYTPRTYLFYLKDEKSNPDNDSCLIT